MAIKNSGILLFTDIVNEFGGSKPHELSEYYRGKAVARNNLKVPESGTIKFSDFYGAVKPFYLEIPNGIYKEMNIKSFAESKGWKKDRPITLVIEKDTWIYSDNTARAALTIPSDLGQPIYIVNRGVIMGKGGDGGYGGNIKGAPGGPALRIEVPQQNFLGIVNEANAYIVGGGGGGGGSGYGGGGGGAGGGRGGNGKGGRGAPGNPGGAGGALGYVGDSGKFFGAPYTNYNYCGSDGGAGESSARGGSGGGGGASAIDTGSSCGIFGGGGGGGGRVIGKSKPITVKVSLSEVSFKAIWPNTQYSWNIVSSTGNTTYVQFYNRAGYGADRTGSYRANGSEGGDGNSSNGLGRGGYVSYGSESGAGGGGGWGAPGGNAAGSKNGNGTAGGAGGSAIVTNVAQLNLVNLGKVWGATTTIASNDQTINAFAEYRAALEAQQSSAGGKK